MLFIVSTPIGNLGDITYRAVETLKICTTILCEDTRRTAILCQRYSITTPLRSYHQFNESSSQERVLEQLRAGEQIALVSDAGTPLISDPGNSIVTKCRDLGIEVTIIPGACAAIAALTGSGMNCETFRFWGFLPRKEGALREQFTRMLADSTTHVCYESPHRLCKTLKKLASLPVTAKVCIARELTKCYEEFISGTTQEVLEHYEARPPKGEIVLLIAPVTTEWQQMAGSELVAFIEREFVLERKQALKLAAQLRGCPKKQLIKEIDDTDGNT